MVAEPIDSIATEILYQIAQLWMTMLLKGKEETPPNGGEGEREATFSNQERWQT